MTSFDEVERTTGGLPVVIAKSPYTRAYGYLKNELSLLENLNRQIRAVFKETAQRGFARVMRGAIEDKSNKENLKKALSNLLEFIDAGNGKDAKTTYLIVDPTAQKFLWDFLCSAGLYRKRQERFVRNMGLVYLVVEFESFLRKILETSFLRRPEILASSHKTITVEELVKFKDIADAREHTIEKEISNILNLDIEEMAKYIEKKFSVEIRHFDNWTKFKERFYRRNILIHNSGIINRHYRLKTGYRGKRRQMIVSKQYLDESVDIFGKMAFVIFRKFYDKFPETSTSKAA